MQKINISILCAWILALSYWLSTPSLVIASGLTLTPSFQEVSVIATESSNPFIATESQQQQTTALVTYHNHNDYPLSLDFSLTSIIATDLFGRFQFNAPLPQTLHSVNSIPTSTQINPQSLSLEPGEIATVSVTFFPRELRPGTNAFLLLANVNAANSTLPTSHSTLIQSLGSGILVNAYGGTNIDLNLVKLEWLSFPVKFTLPDFLTLTLKNDGNLRAIPRGVVSYRDLFDRELYRGVINDSSTVILPGSQRVIYARLSHVKPSWPIMLVNLTVNGYDSDHQSQFSVSKTFVYLNFWLLPGAVVLILILWTIKKRLNQV